ncbi:MAG: cell envelope integrity protein TolA [Opitutaceae bacterium]
MSATSPGAYGMSVLIHGAVVGLVMFFSYAATNIVQDNPKVFELVAGAGDNYGATEAPALGSSGGVKLLSPPVVREAPAPAPAPQPSPIQSAPLEAVPAKAAPPRPAKPVDLVAELKRVEARRERRLEAKYQKEKEAEAKRISQEEFQKAQAAAKAGARVSHIDAEGIKEGVIGGSTNNKTGGAGGRALTREEGSLLDAYFALLKARIKENHTPPEGVSDSLMARLEFLVAVDGSISHVEILKSSGNPQFDLSVVEACERTHSIGPRPDGRSETVQMTFKMREDESP